MKLNRTIISACSVSMTFLVATSLAADYTVTDLGTLGGTSVSALSLNDAGVVVGRADTATNDAYHGILWDGGTLLDLGALPDHAQSRAFAINEAGEVAGVAFTLGDVLSRAVLWSGGGTTELGDFAARDVNESGVVVGTTSIESSGLSATPRAVRYDGSMLLLGTLGGEQSEALAINDLGWIVGGSGLAAFGMTHAFLDINGVMRDLGTLGGNYSFAYDINNARQVVGASKTSAGLVHAFLFQLDDAGTVTSKMDLGELGGSYSAAYGVNEAGQVVGTSNGQAFLWSDGVMSDLNGLIPIDSEWRLHRALAINASGQIVGEGWHQGLARAFLLTPFVACEGDANGDSTVDPLDSGYILARLGCSVGTGDATCDAADQNHDSIVDPLDVGFVLARFGNCE